MTSPMTLRTLLVPPPLLAGALVLEDDQAHHARAVLRLIPGNRVRLADGAGLTAEGTVTLVDKRQVTVAVEAPSQAAAGVAALITVALAPPKGDRLGDVVRALTELGVGTILPLETERSERMPAQFERLQRIAGEALKQCRRAHLPQLGPVTDIPSLVRSGAELTVLDRSGRPAAPGTPRSVTLVIGPEGGLTATELAALTAGGAAVVRLATPILRIETAALAAAAVWTAAWMKDEPA